MSPAMCCRLAPAGPPPSAYPAASRVVGGEERAAEGVSLRPTLPDRGSAEHAVQRSFGPDPPVLAANPVRGSPPSADRRLPKGSPCGCAADRPWTAPAKRDSSTI